MPWNTSAIFEQRSGLDFRTETRLFYAEKEQLIGTIVMINPGSSKRLAEYGILATNNPTFQTVVAIVEDAYYLAGKSLPSGGYIQICNLFDICESDLEMALSKLNEFPYEVVQSSCYRIRKESPWIWLAWGSDKKMELRSAMQKVQDSLCGRNIVGSKIPQEEVGYYHPLYIRRIGKTKPDVQQTLIQQISSFILLK
jgi:hypothetical protein